MERETRGEIMTVPYDPRRDWALEDVAGDADVTMWMDELRAQTRDDDPEPVADWLPPTYGP
jgi:hypothetical protein